MADYPEHILLTNDDGWDAIGLQQLLKASRKFCNVTVVAPLNPQSGCSHQLTLDRKMSFREHAPGVFSLDGTPADCVRVALMHLGIKFDAVISGINDGGNLGADVYLSGTIAAAREANFHGFPSLALSQYRRKYNESYDWSTSTVIAQRVLEHWFTSDWSNPARFGCVNFPDVSSGVDPQTVPITVCPIDTNSFPAEYRRCEVGFQYSGRYSNRAISPGSDMDVCFRDGISWCWVRRDVNH